MIEKWILFYNEQLLPLEPQIEALAIRLFYESINHLFDLDGVPIWGHWGVMLHYVFLCILGFFRFRLLGLDWSVFCDKCIQKNVGYVTLLTPTFFWWLFYATKFRGWHLLFAAALCYEFTRIFRLSYALWTETQVKTYKNPSNVKEGYDTRVVKFSEPVGDPWTKNRIIWNLIESIIFASIILFFLIWDFVLHMVARGGWLVEFYPDLALIFPLTFIYAIGWLLKLIWWMLPIHFLTIYEFIQSDQMY